MLISAVLQQNAALLCARKIGSFGNEKGESPSGMDKGQWVKGNGAPPCG